MNNFEQINQLLNELRTITNYIDIYENKENLCNECNQNFSPSRIYEISQKFKSIKEDIEFQSKMGIPEELVNIRDLCDSLASETTDLYNYIIQKFKVR